MTINTTSTNTFTIILATLCFALSLFFVLADRVEAQNSFTCTGNCGSKPEDYKAKPPPPKSNDDDDDKPNNTGTNVTTTKAPPQPNRDSGGSGYGHGYYDMNSGYPAEIVSSRPGGSMYSHTESGYTIYTINYTTNYGANRGTGSFAVPITSSGGGSSGGGNDDDRPSNPSNPSGSPIIPCDSNPTQSSTSNGKSSPGSLPPCNRPSTPPLPAPPLCTTAPNLYIDNIHFVQRGAPQAFAVDRNKLLINETYDPIITVSNRGCLSTAEVSVHKDQSPFGVNGGFPVRTQIDFGSNGSVEYTQFLNNNGPLRGTASLQVAVSTENSIIKNFFTAGIKRAHAGGSSSQSKSVSSSYTRSVTSTPAAPTVGPNAPHQIFLRMPSVTMTATGVHNIASTVDVTNAEAPGRGCTAGPGGELGCVSEAGLPSNNTTATTFTVVAPAINLGSFLLPTPSTVSDANTSPTRNIATGNQVGLYWTGTHVLYSTCTGVSRNPIGGSVGDFTGRSDPGSNTALYARLPAPSAQVDVNLTEPTANNYHIYTITCGVQGGSGTISDSVTVSNGAVVDNIVILNPSVQDVNVAPGATSVTIPFSILNSGPNPTTAYVTTLSINGTSYGSQGPYSNTIASGASASHSRSVSWTAPNITTNVPYQVCVTHAPGQTTPSCASAILRVAPAPSIGVVDMTPEPPVYQCSDGSDNDRDGAIDYPPDRGCTGPTDNDETNPQCDDTSDNDHDGYNNLEDPGCIDSNDTDESDNALPTITASPTIIRQGATSTISWNPMRYTGCSLSPAMHFGGADVGTSGSSIVTLTIETTFIITCRNIQERVRVRIVPNIFET